MSRELDHLVLSIRGHRGLDIKNLEMQWEPKTKKKLHRLLQEGINQNRLYLGKDGLYRFRVTKRPKRRQSSKRRRKS
jgi:hypothetical protein